MAKLPSPEIRVAPNIYRTPHGWRVYARHAGVLKATRFPPDTTLEELQAFVEAFRTESAKLKQAHRDEKTARAGTFARDAERYLALKVVQAMPSYTDRVRQIGRWVKAFGMRPRSTITTREIDEQLQAWRDAGNAASTVNLHRTALMSLYTRLDGRSAANPTRDTEKLEEPAPAPRGLPYQLIRQLFDAMPDLGRPVKGVKGSRKRGSKTRARLAIMAWTGMTPAQIKLLQPEHLNLKERWYISPARNKGHRRPRHPRPLVKKPMTTEAHAAFARFIKLKAWGLFSTRSLRYSLERARVKVQRELRKTKGNRRLVIPTIRPYDLRHSFATELYRRTGNLPLVAEMLDHSTLQMSRRYALGAVSDVLREGMRQFEAGTQR